MSLRGNNAPVSATVIFNFLFLGIIVLKRFAHWCKTFDSDSDSGLRSTRKKILAFFNIIYTSPNSTFAWNKIKLNILSSDFSVCWHRTVPESVQKITMNEWIEVMSFLYSTSVYMVCLYIYMYMQVGHYKNGNIFLQRK